MSACDLFLSYHSPDRGTVHTVRQLLEARGIATFLDRDNLVAGLPWPHALEDALRSVRAVAVFLGPDGLGLWQKREMGFALERQVQEEKAGRPFPVIPVLLPGSDPTLGFLFLNTWVDLRHDLTDPEAMDALARSVREEAARPGTVHVDLRPYRGLEAFDEEHAAFFVGREAFTDRLREAALSRNLVAVVGPSGSGKSSVVQAGLLPLLRRQGPPARTWDGVSFTPGKQPFRRLAAALIPLLEPALSETDRLKEAQKLGDALAGGEVHVEAAVERLVTKSAGTDRLLVVVDQFEELFTQTPDSDRRPFVAAVLAALDGAPLTLMLTLRADFYGHAIALSRDLSDRVEQRVVNLGPMRREELARAIVEPARRVGLAFEPGLAERILDDVGGEPGRLPLLEFALTELWARRQRQVKLLTHAAYEEIGGVAGAIAQRAKAEFAKFTPERQAIARRVFTRLVRVARPEEGAEDTRQRATMAELSPHPQSDEAAEVRTVVQALTGSESRLLVTGRDQATGGETVEVAHEALIRHWKQLQTWLDEDREFLLWRQRLRGALADWEHTRRDEGTLLRGAPLAEAEHWREERRDDLTPDEKDFIQESVALKVREEAKETERQQRELKQLQALAEEQRQRAEAERQRAEEQARASRRLRLLAAGLAVVTLLAAGAAMFARQQQQQAIAARNRAEQQASLATSRQLSAQAISYLGGQLDLALLLSLQAYRIANTLEARSSLLTGLQYSPRIIAFLRGHRHWVSGVAFHPNRNIVASSSLDKTIVLWDVATRQPLGPPFPAHTARLSSVASSPDGKTLASGSSDKTIILWDVATRQPLGPPLTGHNDIVWSMAFSPDGKTLASGSRDKAIILWDVATRQPLGPPLTGHTNIVLSVAFSPDGKTLASGSGDHTLLLWEVATRQVLGLPLTRHTGAVMSLAFSPDGTMLASGSADKTSTLWDVATWQPLGPALTGHTTSVRSLAFSPDGNTLVSSSDDSTILWDLDLESWQTRACRMVNRNLTRAEWNQFIPADMPYERTCPNLPLGEGVPPTVPAAGQ